MKNNFNINSIFPLDTSNIFRNYQNFSKKLKDSKKRKIIKLAILSVSSTHHIKKLTELFFLIFGIKAIIYEAKFGQYYEEAVFTNKKLRKFKPDFIWINISNKIFNNDNEFEYKKINISTINKKINEIIYNLQKNYNAQIILNNIDYLNQKDFNILDRNKNQIYKKIDKINKNIHKVSSDNFNIKLLDINHISSSIGLLRWNSIQDWTQYKYHPSLNSSAYLAYELSSIVKSSLGLDKKCIVLDLDNTLWEGVIGDIGPEKINYDKNDSIGYSYYRLQCYLKKLKQMGIILTIVSKNSYENVSKIFNDRRLVLKKSDFAKIICNWKNKDENILEIAKSLNILTESMIFIDDNPFERNLVSKNIPDIVVLDLPVDHADWIKYIENFNFFYNTHITNEDKNRTKTLGALQEIDKIYKNSPNNYLDYLKSLKMQVKIFTPSKHNHERTIQLINKTNQFNLTKKSLNLKDLKVIEKDKNKFIYLISLRDNITDYGIISILWGNTNDNLLSIENWVMSCRVFNRYLDHVIIYYLFKKYKKISTKITLSYKKSFKNKILQEIFENLGSKKIKNKFVVYNKKFLSNKYKLFSLID